MIWLKTWIRAKLFSIFLELSKIKIEKAGVKLQTMWHCKYSGILESKVKFDETYMKMSKYENSAFPYPVHSTVNLPAWLVFNFLLKCEPLIKTRNSMIRSKKYTQIYFIFYILKELSPNYFLIVFYKTKFLKRSCKISRRDKY